jgi:hypothetical protein
MEAAGLTLKKEDYTLRWGGMGGGGQGVGCRRARGPAACARAGGAADRGTRAALTLWRRHLNPHRA